MKKEQEEKGRRGFLRNLISGGFLLLTPKLLKAKATNGETVKMLTPDGKMLEVDKSKIQNSTNARIASNREVMDWMNTKSKNS